MKVPVAFRSLYAQRTGILVVGETIIALVLAAVALGVTGLAVAVFLLVLVAFAELWREVVRYEASVATLETAAQAGAAAADQVKDLKRQVTDLKAKNKELLRQASSPSSSHEGLLAAVSVHLSVLGLVEKHRAMREDLPDAPVTQAQVSNDDSVKITANCPKSPEIFVGESTVIVDSHSGEQVSGIATVEGSNGSDVFALFDKRVLPTELVENLRQLDKVIPDGYALRPAGLTKEFDGMSDESLHGLVVALEGARNAIHAVMTEVVRDTDFKKSEVDIKELASD